MGGSLVAFHTNLGAYIRSQHTLLEVFDEATKDKDYLEVIDNRLTGVSMKDINKSSGARKYKDVYDEISLIRDKDGRYMMTYDGNKIVVPKGMRKKILSQLHRSHTSTDLFVETLRTMYYWPHMRAEVQAMVDDCEGCNEFRPSLQREPQDLTRRQSLLTMQPMQNMPTDLFHVNGDPYIVLVDRYSSFIWADKVKDETTSTVIKYLEGIFYDFGFPKRLRSDGGPCFRGSFSSWCKENYIVHELSSAYYSQSNGLAEISVKKAKRLVQKTKKLKENLQQAIFQMRNTRLKSVGASPSELFFKRDVRNPLPNLPKELDLDTAIMNKEMKSVDLMRKKIPSVPLKVGQRIEIQNVKSKRWDMRGTVMRMREGGQSYYIHIDGDDKNVLRNRIFLRPLKESELPGGASYMEYGVLEEDHVVDSELHSPRPTSPVTQADAMMDCGSSSSCEDGAPCWRSNEAVGEQRSKRKPTRMGREHPSTAARHAQ